MSLHPDMLDPDALDSDKVITGVANEHANSLSTKSTYYVLEPSLIFQNVSNCRLQEMVGLTL